MPNPIVDILMATYNGERYVAEQIESIQRQTYQDWRLLVSDDCSNDNTLGIVRSYLVSDPRIRIVSEGVHRGGARENFISLLLKSKSPYAMFCDQDDVWLPEKIEVSLSKLCSIEEPQPGTPCLVFTDMEVVDANLNRISPSFEKDSNIDPTRTSFPQVLAQSLGAGCTMMFNHPLVELMARNCDYNGMIMHDHWATIVSAAFGRIGYVDRALSLYRQHGDNTIGADKFSLVDRAVHLDRMKRRYIANVAQAKAFLDIYENELNREQRKIIQYYVATLHDTPIRSISDLFHSGCWKKGSRKIGQFFCAASIRI